AFEQHVRKAARGRAHVQTDAAPRRYVEAFQCARELESAPAHIGADLSAHFERERRIELLRGLLQRRAVRKDKPRLNQRLRARAARRKAAFDQKKVGAAGFAIWHGSTSFL